MFIDRIDAGRQLAGRLAHLHQSAPVVLGLPRGGVVVAAQVAAALNAPLDVLVVRKIGAPWQPELAIGAVIDGPQPQTALNDALVRSLGVDSEYVEKESRYQLAEAARREKMYRKNRPALECTNRTIIIVDDGVATGASVQVALMALRTFNPARLVLAIPVGPPAALDCLHREVDELICLETPPKFHAVGEYYKDFKPTSDEEVIEILNRAAIQAEASSTNLD